MNLYTIKKILVPLDLSETSLNALDTAICLAKKHNALLRILHVDEIFPGISNDGLHHLFSLHKNEDVLNALTGSISHTHAIKPGLIQKTGYVVESIISTVISDQIDLIVMGTHGASGVREGFIGANTYNVIKYSPCPVLTIPPRRKFSSFRKALFPIRPVAGALMPYHAACHFMSPNSTLDILGVSYLRMDRKIAILDKIVEEIKDKLEEDKIKVKMSWGTGTSIADDIIEFTAATNPDIIILTSIVDTVTKLNFIGPYSQKLINQSTVPLLSIKRLGTPVFA